MARQESLQERAEFNFELELSRDGFEYELLSHRIENRSPQLAGISFEDICRTIQIIHTPDMNRTHYQAEPLKYELDNLTRRLALMGLEPSEHLNLVFQPEQLKIFSQPEKPLETIDYKQSTLSSHAALIYLYLKKDSRYLAASAQNKARHDRLASILTEQIYSHELGPENLARVTAYQELQYRQKLFSNLVLNKIEYDPHSRIFSAGAVILSRNLAQLLGYSSGKRMKAGLKLPPGRRSKDFMPTKILDVLSQASQKTLDSLNPNRETDRVFFFEMVNFHYQANLKQAQREILPRQLAAAKRQIPCPDIQKLIAEKKNWADKLAYLR